MIMAKRKRLEVIKRYISPNLCYAEVTCELGCKPSAICSWVLKTSGVAEYVEIMAEHKLGLWGRVTQSVLERDVLIGGREFMFSFGTRPDDTFLTIFLDCRYRQVRICGIPELIFSFIKAFNGEIVIKSLLYEYAKAVLQHEEVV